VAVYLPRGLLRVGLIRLTRADLPSAYANHLPHRRSHGRRRLPRSQCCHPRCGEGCRVARHRDRRHLRRVPGADRESDACAQLGRGVRHPGPGRHDPGLVQQGQPGTVRGRHRGGRQGDHGGSSPAVPGADPAREDRDADRRGRRREHDDRVGIGGGGAPGRALAQRHGRAQDHRQRHRGHGDHVRIPDRGVRSRRRRSTA
jgi:hypothetical protein